MIERLVSCAVLAVAAIAAPLTGAAPAAAAPTSGGVRAAAQVGSSPCTSPTPNVTRCLYTHIGGEQSFTIPIGIDRLDVVVVGGSGGNGGFIWPGDGGAGAEITGRLAVGPGTSLPAGTILYIAVGGNGGKGGFFGGRGSAGWNGGAQGGYGGNWAQIGDGGGGGGGGGASDIRTCSRTSTRCDSLASRVLVAAGGGGGAGAGGGTSDPGDGGAAGAGGASSNDCGPCVATGGSAGTATGGGSAGLGNPTEAGNNGDGGTLGTGGLGGGAFEDNAAGGGGGGGGVYGGGGGGGLRDSNRSSDDAAGGGGGSSLVPPGTTLALATTSRLISLSYDDPGAVATPPIDGTPARIADTRDGTGGVPIAPLAPGDVLRVRPSAFGGAPVDAAAVALNVTAAEPAADGYVAVFACDEAPPPTSNVSYLAGQLAKPGAVISAGEPGTGDVCITTYAETDIVVDLSGWFAPGFGVRAATPFRILDTREATGAQARRFLEPGEVLTVPVASDDAIGAAALTLTATEAAEPGYLTAYPCTEAVPHASSVNFDAGAAASNAVLTDLDDDGQVCVIASTAVHVVVDVAGWFADVAAFQGDVPRRALDTRSGVGLGAPDLLLPGDVFQVDTGIDPAPFATAFGAALNVTATEAESAGYLTVFPCDGDAPGTSNVNYTADAVASPNAVITTLATSGASAGRVCITTSSAVHVVVDVTGAFVA